jgi:hypothetical protein
VPDIPGPLSGILNPGGFVGNSPVTQRGPVTYVGTEPISSDGRYLGSTPITQDGRGTWVGGDLVTPGNRPYIGMNEVFKK